MNRLLKYLIVGIFFASVVEIVNIGVLSGGPIGFLLTILVVYVPFILLAYFVGGIIDKRLSKARSHILHYVIFGFIGLIIEWFVIGNFIFSQYIPFIITLLMQLGMFSYWGTVAFAPRVFLEPNSEFCRIRKPMVIYLVIFIAFTYILTFSVDIYSMFVVFSLLMTGGFAVLNAFYIWFFKMSSSVKSQE